MCPPFHFAVSYAINPWMRPDQPADARRAVRQWERLRQVYTELGHTVHLIEPVPGLPDMVFAANGATVVGGGVLGARFRYPERAAEAGAYLDWFRGHGYTDVRAPELVNEGEGDILCTGTAPCWPGTASGPTRAPRPSWKRPSACPSTRSGWSTRGSTIWTRPCACWTRTPPPTTRRRSTTRAGPRWPGCSAS